ncbi:hypothetical protein [Nonomuraea fuscirosea]
MTTDWIGPTPVDLRVGRGVRGRCHELPGSEGGAGQSMFLIG